MSASRTTAGIVNGVRLETVRGENRVALVPEVASLIGASDVANPVARNGESGPICGMPILNADKAKNVIVIQRGQGRSFSGIEHAPFFLDNTRRPYGKAQGAVSQLIPAIKGSG